MANKTKVVITAETSQAEAALIFLNKGVQGAAKELISLSGIAGVLSIGAIGAFVKKSIDAADELAALSEKTGTSVEALAGLKYAAEQNDTSLTSVADAAKKLSTNLAENPELFARFGITAKDTTGALIQLSDIFKSMPDGVEKTALAVKLMGKSGEEMIPLLNQGGKELAAFVEEGKRLNPITDQSVAAAREFNDQLSRMQSEASSFGIAISKNLLPGLVETTTRMNELTAAGHPLLALWRGLIGMGKVPYDLLMPPDNLKEQLSYAGQLAIQQEKVAALQRKVNGGWGETKTARLMEELSKENATLETMIAHAFELNKSPASQETKPNQAGSNLLNSLGTNSTKTPKPFDPEGDFFAAVDEARTKNDKKTQDEFEKAYASEQEKYARLHELGIAYTASEEERLSWKLAFDLESMDKEHQANIDKYGRNTELDIAYEAARLERMQMAEAEAAAISAKTAKREEDERQNKIRADMSIANFSELLRQKDYSGAMGMAEKLSAGMATKHRAMFEVNKAASLASTTIKGYQAVVDAYEHGTMWGGPLGGVAEAAIAAAYVATQLDAINSTSFGGGGGATSSGGGIPSQSTSPGIPVSQQPAQQQEQQPVQVNIYNTGNVMTNDFITNTIIPQIKDSISNSDVLIIDPRSRQAQVLGAA